MTFQSPKSIDTQTSCAAHRWPSSGYYESLWSPVSGLVQFTDAVWRSKKYECFINYFFSIKITGRPFEHCSHATLCLQNLIASNWSNAEFRLNREKGLFVSDFHWPQRRFSPLKILFLSRLFEADAKLVPIHHHLHHHHAWTFLDFLWRCISEPDRQRKGSPAKSLDCRHGFFLSSLLPRSFFGSLSIVAVFPRSLGDAPACLPLRLNLSILPSIPIVLSLWTPAPLTPPLPHPPSPVQPPPA